MPQRLFLCVTNHHLVVYPWEHNAFGAPTILEQERDVGRFQELLEGYPGSFSVHVLIDLTEEELKLERIPRLNPLVRTRMLENRSTRLLRHSPFRHVIYLGRDPAEPGQDCALFSGLVDPDTLLVPWLEVLQKRRLPLAGIWSIPLLTPRLFQGEVKPEHTDVLLLSFNSGGLRQTFLHQGQLLLSRLSRLPSQEAEDLVPFLHGEVVRMQGYLVSQRLYAWNAELHVHILCNAALFGLLNQGPLGTGSYHLHPLHTGQLAARVGLKSDPDVGRMDPLFGQALLRWSIPNHYARPEDRKVFQTLRLGRMLRRVAFGLFGASLLVCLFFFWQGRAQRDQQPDLTRQAEEIQQATRRIPDNRPPVEGRRIISAARWAELLESHAMDPRQTLHALGQILARHDRLILEGLEWSSGEGAGGSQPGPPGPPGKPGQSRPPPPPPQVSPPEAQILLINGRVEPYATLQEAMTRVEMFIQELRALPEFMEVQPVQMPLNVTQNQVIQGGEVQARSKAVFILRIMLSRRKEG
ncbi:MAG: hypothetical protein HQL95_03925 [Magnetococcales bacterium]|nr:hypothetical protein [Magnetococcales bacterium]